MKNKLTLQKKKIKKKREKQCQESDKVHRFNKKLMNKNFENSDIVFNNFTFKKISGTNEELNELSADKFFSINK